MNGVIGIMMSYDEENFSELETTMEQTNCKEYG